MSQWPISVRTSCTNSLGPRLLRGNQTVVLEDPNVSGILKNRKLAHAIADAGWRIMRTLLVSKAAKRGRAVVTLNRWPPTFPTCWACGCQDGAKPLSLPRRRCAACGTEQDRDVHAAKNILTAGLAERLNNCGVESQTSVLVPGVEAGGHLKEKSAYRI